MRYTLTALLLAPVWLGVLSWAPGVALWGLPPLRSVIPAGMAESHFLPLWIVYLLFPVASVGLSLGFKKWLTRCEGAARLLPSLALPAIAVLVFVAAGCLWAYASGRLSTDGLMGSLYFGFIYLLISEWLIVPMGIFSHACLLGAYHCDQRRTSPRADAQWRAQRK